jgi:hypothetical protein
MAAPASGWWRVCPGCECERQLDRAAVAAGRERMADHNRFDRDRRVMVRCEGSGQPPAGDTSSGGGRGEGDAA